MRHLASTGEAIARLGTDICSRNIAEAQACMRMSIAKLEQIDAIVRTGGVITDVTAARAAVEELLAKRSPTRIQTKERA